MAITRKLNETVSYDYAGERDYRASKLVEKWSRIPQVGKGIAKMSESKAKNLAILLENQARYMQRMNEATFASSFNTTPENLLKLIRIVYPNAVRADLFTEFAMETANDSIQYIEPVYEGTTTPIYEQVGDKTGVGAKSTTSSDNCLIFNASDEIIGAYVGGTLIGVTTNASYYVAKGADVQPGTVEGNGLNVDLGMVDINLRRYQFQPKALTLGVRWTQLSELILDTSFGTSSEDMLMTSASQEIKKAMDYQSIALANLCAQGSVEFDAMNAGTVTSQPVYSYNGETFEARAQVVTKAIDKCKNAIYNSLHRGGVSAIVGSPDVIDYFKLHRRFEAKGAQQAMGAYKVGELDGIALYEAPKEVFGGVDKAVTTWKNEAAGMDVSLAIGTLMPMYSTGVLPRMGMYKEAGLARFEDEVVLNKNYLRNLTINNLV